MDVATYAGSAQLLMVELWKAPLTFIEMVIAVFAINLRYFLIGVSFTPLFKGKSILHKTAMTYLLRFGGLMIGDFLSKHCFLENLIKRSRVQYYFLPMPNMLINTSNGVSFGNIFRVKISLQLRNTIVPELFAL